MGRPVIVFVCLFGVACVPPGSASSARPLSNDASECALRLSTRVETNEGSSELVAEMFNQTDTELRFSISNRCPDGDAVFSGLGHDYDYYATCMSGGCRDNDPRLIVVAPGQTLAFARMQIAPEGAGCNEPRHGTFPITYTIVPVRGSSMPATCGPEPIDVVYP